MYLGLDLKVLLELLQEISFKFDYVKCEIVYLGHIFVNKN